MATARTTKSDPPLSAAATPRRTQEERSAESRERLIAAAIELLGAKGYSRTTLVDIGKRAGLSRGLVTFHFGSKEQCMAAVVDTIRAMVTAELDRKSADARGLEAVDLMIDTYLTTEEFRSSHAMRAMFAIIMESITESSILRKSVAEQNAIFRRMLADWITQAHEDGDIELRDDPLGLATLIEGLLRGTLIQSLTDPDAVDLRAIAKLSKAVVRNHLQASPGRLSGTDVTSRVRSRGSATSA
ncbi:TetR/AcrR family transcriptional regulator [Hoyosella subflava]|nr:TetR/AcrR family transcriptional regulator [Hoyosella subflava]